VKVLTVWTMADQTGQLSVRDWSGGGSYNDADFKDKVVRLRRVRVASMSNGSNKHGEFLPGRNGTMVGVTPAVGLEKWWLGEAV